MINNITDENKFVEGLDFSADKLIYLINNADLEEKSGVVQAYAACLRNRRNMPMLDRAILRFNTRCNHELIHALVLNKDRTKLGAKAFNIISKGLLEKKLT